MINQTNQVMKKYGNNEEIDLKSLTFKKRQQFSVIPSSSLNHAAYPSAIAREMEKRVEGHSRHFPASRQQSQQQQMLELQPPVPPQSRISHLKEKALAGDLETKV